VSTSVGCLGGIFVRNMMETVKEHNLDETRLPVGGVRVLYRKPVKSL